MNWRVVARPEIEQDVTEGILWYESKQSGLGAEFLKEIFVVFDSLEVNPFLNSRRHSIKEIHWRYSKRFPYRIVYEVMKTEKTIVIAAVLHAARSDRHWQRRV